ncbi:MAG: beta-ketoacyl synthase N-terminal-like domain-containing protein, partial [Candidatus Omnitrophota bacterium]
MSIRRVVVTGMGLVTPVGSTIESFWTSLLEGKSGVSRITCFDPSNFSSHIAAEVKNFDPSLYLNPKEVKKTDRFVQFAIVASKFAVDMSGLKIDETNANNVGVLIGSGIGGLHTIEAEHRKFIEKGPVKGPGKISPFLIPMLIVNMASGQVAMTVKAKGPNTAVATACASGNHAIGDAFRIIQRGEADVMITGGSEAAITFMGFGGFCALRALSTRNDDPTRASRPFDKERDGFII